jgi:hypothetical protein
MGSHLIRRALRVTVHGVSSFIVTTEEGALDYARSVKMQNEKAGRLFKMSKSNDGKIIDFELTYRNVKHKATGQIRSLMYGRYNHIPD